MSYSSLLVCNEVHNSTFGSIRSINFSNNYPRDATCHYLIINSDPETRITVRFLRFNLHPYSHTTGCSGFVKIYDGNSTKATQIGREDGYCGNRAPPTLTIASTGNIMLIVFVSKSFYTSAGFSATYTGRIVFIHFDYVFHNLIFNHACLVIMSQLKCTIEIRSKPYKYVEHMGIVKCENEQCKLRQLHQYEVV